MQLPVSTLLAASVVLFGTSAAPLGQDEEAPPQPAPVDAAPAESVPAQDASASDPAQGAEAVGFPPLVFDGAMVHTLVPGEEPRIASVVIADGRIVEVSETPTVPSDAVRIDVTGKHLVPPLIDGYVNFDPEHDLIYTMSGIGVVRDMGGDYLPLIEQRDPARRARALGPDLLTAGAVLDGDPPISTTAAVLRDVNAASNLVPILLNAGVDFLSCHMQLLPDVRARVIELADEAGVDVWSFKPADVDIEELVDAGVDGVYPLDALRPASVAWDVVKAPAFKRPGEKLAESGTYLIPLFFASALRIEDQSRRPDTEAILSLLPPFYTMWWQSELADRRAVMTEESHALEQRVVEKQATIIKQLFDAGVHLVPGSGAAQPWIFPGRGLHRELELWAIAGIPPADILRLATRSAAEAFGIEDEHGSLQPGAQGSLLVLDGDPTQDIAALGKIDAIALRGRLLGAEDFDAMIKAVAARQELARQENNAPVEVEPPPIPEDAEVLLGGVAETRSFGMRLWTECFRVARKPDGRVMVLGRVVYPGTSGGPEEMLVSQIVENGKLTAAEVVLRNGDVILRFEGLWTAGNWMMRRTIGNESLGNVTSQQQPIVCDVGSITSVIVLGQARLSDRFPIIRLHQGLEPESAFWRMELDSWGQHQVRTHLGRMAFRFDDFGAPLQAITLSGTRGVETVLIERELFDGPGWPLPDETAARIDELVRAAEAAAAAEASAGEATPEAENESQADAPVDAPATGGDG